MKKQKPKVEIDYTPYHVRQQAWYMSLLKFYKNIEYDDKIYTDFATKLFAGKIDQKILKQLDSLRRKHNQQEKKMGRHKTKGCNSCRFKLPKYI